MDSEYQKGVVIVEIQELKQRIKEDDIPNFMIFTGEEYAIQKIYIQHIAKIKNLTVRYIDSVTEILTELGSQSFLKVNYCYVVLDDKELISNETLQKELISRLNTDILILTLTSVDKRTKLYKTYKDSIIEFNALKSEIMKRYIQKEIKLSDENCDKLIEVCEGNYGRILLEIDKIRRYSTITWNKREIRERDCGWHWINECFNTLLDDGVLVVPPKDAIFDLVKAILQNKPALAFDLLQNCKEVGESSLAILSVLFNSTKQLLQVQSCESKDIEKTTGLTYWQIRNAKECCGIYSNNNLIYIMKLIQSVERRIKTGEIEELIAVEYVLSDIL